MNENDYAIRHFDRMRRFATELEALPATILEHRCRDEVFGSWSTTIRFEGHVFRLAYDGRDGEMALEHSVAKKWPYGWQGPVWSARVAREAEVSASELKALMSDAITAA